MPTSELKEKEIDRAFSLLDVGGLTATEIAKRMGWDYTVTWSRLRSRTGDKGINEYVQGVRARRCVILRRAFGMGPTETSKLLPLTRQRVHHLLTKVEPCGNPQVLAHVVGRISDDNARRSPKTNSYVSVGWLNDQRASVKDRKTDEVFFVRWRELLDNLTYVGLINGNDEQREESWHGE